MNSLERNTDNKRPTLALVAKLAGVSKITASRALRDGTVVAPETRRRVEEAARALNYVPNRLAGTLAGATSFQIAVVLPSLSNIVFADVLKGLETRLEDAGYHPILGISHYDPEREEHLIRDLLSWRPAGLVLAPARKSEGTRAMLRSANVPVVEVMDVDAATADMAVGFSHREAGRSMAYYLSGRGYRRFGYVGHQISTDFRAVARLDGFREGLDDAGAELVHTQILDGPSSVPLGREGLDRLLRTASTRPDAVFFSNDDMAVGGVFHCQAAGLSVPGDIALAGFNGLSIGQALPVPLTTIASNRERIGLVAAETFLERLAGKVPQPIKRVEFKLLPGGTA